MQGASKKQRGKQRKAAKDRIPPNISFAENDDGDALVEPNHKEYVIKHIQGGSNSITKTLAHHHITNFSLVDSGVLSAVLEFLGRCEDESFIKVLRTSNVYADLISPVYWIEILEKAVEFEPGSRLQVAQQIGPLVRCMCNDTERLFFRNNKHWREGIVSFTLLVSEILRSSVNDYLVVDTLLQHEGLLASIVQWNFWKEHRPDIAKELDADEFAAIVGWAMDSIKILVIDAVANNISTNTKDRQLLGTIGCVPIVSKDYDPNCMISFAVGMICLVKVKGWGRIMGSVKVREYAIILQPLVKQGDCIDKDVILELIDLGMNYTNELDSAQSVLQLSHMIFQESNYEEGKVLCDTRVAFAIRSGVVDMCLSFIERFGVGDLDHYGSLVYLIHRIISMINDVSFQEKTWKAIRHKRSSVKETLVRLEENADITSKEYKKLLDRFRSIFDINGSYCCRCNKSLTRTEAKQCNGCHRMTYCSKECQRDDWLNGHKLTCCKPYTDENVGQFQGRLEPKTLPECPRIAAKLKELEINSTMIQLKLLADNSDTILSRAKELNLPLHDCVIVFDLRECPVTMAVLNYTDYYRTSLETCGRFRETRSEENITCFYYFPLCMRGLHESLFKMQKLYPVWLINE